MNRRCDIHGTVSKTRTASVEQTRVSGGGCCYGLDALEVRLAGVRVVRCKQKKVLP